LGSRIHVKAFAARMACLNLSDPLTQSSLRSAAAASTGSKHIAPSDHIVLTTTPGRRTTAHCARESHVPCTHTCSRARTSSEDPLSQPETRLMPSSTGHDCATPGQTRLRSSSAGAPYCTPAHQQCVRKRCRSQTGKHISPPKPSCTKSMLEVEV